jgi:hypothetical protein
MMSSEKLPSVVDRFDDKCASIDHYCDFDRIIIEIVDEVNCANRAAFKGFPKGSSLGAFPTDGA